MQKLRGSLLQIILLALNGCDRPGISTSHVDATRTEAPSPLTVEVISAKEVANDIKTVVLYGRLQPRKQAVLRFQKPGRVEKVAAVGEKYSSGDILATLDQTELVRQRDEAVKQIAGLQTQATAVPQSQQTALRQQIASLATQQKQLDATIAAGTIVAPFDCRVHTCDVAVGDDVSPAIGVATVFSDEGPLLSATIDEDSAAQLTDRQKFWVAIEDKVFECRRAASTGSNAWAFEFSEPLPEDYWQFQNVVEIRYRVATGLNGFWLPLEALRQRADQQWSVLVGDRDEGADEDVRVSERNVNVERMTTGFVLVTGDLAPGDSVVASGGHRIVPGQQVILSKSRLEWSRPGESARAAGDAQ